MSGITFDSGALIALEKNDRRVVAALRIAIEANVPLVVPAGAVGQAWRNGATQARLARFLASREVSIEPLDDLRARAAGQLCAVSGTSDVIDASVVLSARSRGDRVFTSDVGALRRLDATIELVLV